MTSAQLQELVNGLLPAPAISLTNRLADLAAGGADLIARLDAELKALLNVPGLDELTSTIDGFMEDVGSVAELVSNGSEIADAAIADALDDLIPEEVGEAFETLNDCLDDIEHVVDGISEDTIAAIDELVAPLEDAAGIYEAGKPLFEALEAYP